MMYSGSFKTMHSCAKKITHCTKRTKRLPYFNFHNEYIVSHTKMEKDSMHEFSKYHTFTKNKSYRLFSSLSNSSEVVDTKKINLSNEIKSSDGVVGIPIDFDVSSRVEGKESQVS